MIKDYYNILGIEKNAERKEIISAFRFLAKKYHPDKNDPPQATDKFKEIYEAYEILKDPLKRKEYDLLYEEKFKEAETHHNYHNESVNSWVNSAHINFDVYINLNLKNFLKVTLDKVTYQSLKTIRIGIIAILFTATLIFAFLSFLAVLGFGGHLIYMSITPQVFINFVLIISIEVGLILYTRKLLFSYKKQYNI